MTRTCITTVTAIRSEEWMKAVISGQERYSGKWLVSVERWKYATECTGISFQSAKGDGIIKRQQNWLLPRKDWVMPGGRKS